MSVFRPGPTGLVLLCHRCSIIGEGGPPHRYNTLSCTAPSKYYKALCQRPLNNAGQILLRIKKGERGTFRPGPIRIPGLTGCRPVDCAAFVCLLEAVVIGANTVGCPSSVIDSIVGEEDVALNLVVVCLYLVYFIKTRRGVSGHESRASGCSSNFAKQCARTHRLTLPPDVAAAPLAEMAAPRRQRKYQPA